MHQLGVRRPPAVSGMFLKGGRNEALAPPFRRLFESLPEESQSPSQGAPKKTVLWSWCGPKGGSFGKPLTFGLPLGSTATVEQGGRAVAWDAPSLTHLSGASYLIPLKRFSGCKTKSFNVLSSLNTY